MSDTIIGRAAFGPTADCAQPRLTLAELSATLSHEEAENRALLAELERELGVKGTAAVFRRSLALAKAARAALG